MAYNRDFQKSINQFLHINIKIEKKNQTTNFGIQTRFSKIEKEIK
jgi:hypothetical protein